MHISIGLRGQGKRGKTDSTTMRQQKQSKKMRLYMNRNRKEKTCELCPSDDIPGVDLLPRNLMRGARSAAAAERRTLVASIASAEICISRN